ncbi:alpha/beta hydrolase [Streptomyces sp. PTM05]|uniref:Alpha/beta hydrolase n=1 Tax=Streptantibioticus parmotrematis TaxID=2873249 RepID=A0ABS7R2D4_9ACTN|nr:alpha/beta hydrolase [Streptantibioticus parmotrematis]MBY8888197.1 alpha/beta hydrolase [Streptantibioticus parmotrematis]
MPEIELSAGVIDYTDTGEPGGGERQGGTGETLVLVPGLGFGASVWDPLVRELRDEFRIVVPVLPIGAHRRPARPDADLSAQGVAGLLAEFLERLDLRDVTLVQNDAGTAQLLVGVRDERVGRLVLTSCEALDNYPPGMQGKALELACSVPGGLFLMLQAFRVPFLVGLPFSLGGMAHRPIPYELVREWYGPLLTDAAIRRDLTRFLRSTRKDTYRQAAGRLREFDRPALVAWGARDVMMPPATGRRLAELLPHGRYVEIPDARTLVQLDNPTALATELRRFVAENPLT